MLQKFQTRALPHSIIAAISATVVLSVSTFTGCDPADNGRDAAMKSELMEVESNVSEDRSFDGLKKDDRNKYDDGQNDLGQNDLGQNDQARKDRGSVAVARKDVPEAETPEVMFSLRLFSWNIESEGSDPEVVADQLQDMDRYDIYALSEVLPTAADTLNDAVGRNYKGIVSRSGYNDRLAIFFNTDLFDEVKHFEIESINFKNRYRAPLVVQLKHRDSGLEFMVMNNHLARGKAEVRAEQARQLVEWARTQLLPVVALGDYNFDYEFATAKGNEGFDNMLKDNVWNWVEPVELIDSNWYDNPQNPDGKDDYPGSILDFAFVSGPAKAWKKSCKVIVRPGDFPDDELTSDHRPFELILSN